MTTVGKDEAKDATCKRCIAVNNGEPVDLPDESYPTGSLDAADALTLPLIFYAPPPLTEAQRAEWKRITGTDQMTTRVMCDHLRLVHALVKYPLDRDLERERES